MASVFTKAFWLNELEAALTTAAATFAGSQIFIQGFSQKGFETAAAATGVAVLYQFVKAIGGLQAVKNVLKVEVKAG